MREEPVVRLACLTVGRPRSDSSPAADNAQSARQAMAQRSVRANQTGTRYLQPRWIVLASGLLLASERSKECSTQMA